MADHDYDFDLSGGDLSLDLVNTLSGRGRPGQTDSLATYGRLVDWAEQSALLSPDEAARLRAFGGAQPGPAGAILTRGITLREALWSLAHAAMEGVPPTAADLTILNAELARATTAHEVAWFDGRFVCNDLSTSAGPDAILGKVASAAAGLLCSPNASRIRECGSETCTWLFLDLSKNRSRRWCDMSSCGNREKVRQFRARKTVKA